MRAVSAREIIFRLFLGTQLATENTKIFKLIGNIDSEEIMAVIPDIRDKAYTSFIFNICYLCTPLYRDLYVTTPGQVDRIRPKDFSGRYPRKTSRAMS